MYRGDGSLLNGDEFCEFDSLDHKLDGVGEIEEQIQRWCDARGYELFEWEDAGTAYVWSVRTK